MRSGASALLLSIFGLTAFAGEIRFTREPKAARARDRVKISFAVSKATDVEVAVLDSEGRVVRHLAAGVLGADVPPPAPLRPGLGQELEWDLRDDFGEEATGGPFRVRVRAGMGAELGRLIGGDPCTFGSLHGVAVDEEGNVYVLGARGILNQGHMTLRVFDPEGRYLREIMPFPADLSPGSMKDVARWDEEKSAFRPRNLKNLNPDFYGCPGKWAGALELVSASKERGVRLTDGTRIFTLETSGAVRGPRFITGVMWKKKMIPWGGIQNSGGGPIHLAFNPDGKYVYLSGVYTCKTRYGHKIKPELPPGRVFRMRLDGSETMKEFVTIDVAHEEGAGGEWKKKLRKPGNFTAAKGPVHGIAVDEGGRVYVCDREHDRVAVFDRSGELVAELPVGWPDLVAVHPRTGAVYVMTRDCVAYRRYEKLLLKFNTIEDRKPAAEYDLGPAGARPAMALWAGEGKTVVWIVGVEGQLVALEDKGRAFEPMKTYFKPREGAQLDWNRLAVDYARDELYVNDGASAIWRYDGRTGKGERLKKDGKLFWATDLAVGYDGLLYVRTGLGRKPGTDYSGPFERYTRDLDPAPYDETGTHVLSKYIYSRYGVGYAERGIGVGPRGEVYLSFMYAWVNYMVAGFDAHGRPIKGRYLKGKVQPDNFKRGQNKDLDSAVIGPITAANGGIRVDLDGNIYLGVWAWPADAPVPEGFETDRGYLATAGSVFKFTPDGGFLSAPKGWGGSDGVVKVPRTPQAGGIEVRSGALGKSFRKGFLEGAVAAYPGIAPFSHNGFGGNSCCVCRVPRFDIDLWGRLVMPNAVTNSVSVVDNAGNEIVRFGKYGNFDSQFVKDAEEEPIVSVPKIPLAWPTGAGWSAEHIYVNDTLSRRVVRLDKTYAAEETCGVR